MLIGQIELFDDEKKTGIVKSQEDYFEFQQSCWLSTVPPEQGDEVSFEVHDGEVVSMRLIAETLEPVKAVKRRLVAAFLALFLGFIGAHRLYLGYYKLALAQIALTALTHGYGVLWGFIEAILLFSGQITKDSKNRPLK
jgi:TM2 domain-containing membrane protein YozV